MCILYKLTCAAASLASATGPVVHRPHHALHCRIACMPSYGIRQVSWSWLCSAGDRPEQRDWFRIRSRACTLWGTHRARELRVGFGGQLCHPGCQPAGKPTTENTVTPAQSRARITSHPVGNCVCVLRTLKHHCLCSAIWVLFCSPHPVPARLVARCHSSEHRCSACKMIPVTSLSYGSTVPLIMLL